MLAIPFPPAFTHSPWCWPRRWWWWGCASSSSPKFDKSWPKSVRFGVGGAPRDCIENGNRKFDTLRGCTYSSTTSCPGPPPPRAPLPPQPLRARAPPRTRGATSSCPSARSGRHRPLRPRARREAAHGGARAWAAQSQRQGSTHTNQGISNDLGAPSRRWTINDRAPVDR